MLPVDITSQGSLELAAGLAPAMSRLRSGRFSVKPHQRRLEAEVGLAPTHDAFAERCLALWRLGLGGSGRCCPDNTRLDRMVCLANSCGHLSIRVASLGGGGRTCTSPPNPAPRFQRGGPPAAQRLREFSDSPSETRTRLCSLKDCRPAPSRWGRDGLVPRTGVEPTFPD